MEYQGKLYAKIGGKYIECTETVSDLEDNIKDLELRLERIKRLKLNWIDANKEQPERIYGENYSKNVLAIINGKLGVACYCYNTSEEEEECGYFWANCYGNIDGDAEFESLLP